MRCPTWCRSASVPRFRHPERPSFWRRVAARMFTPLRARRLSARMTEEFGFHLDLERQKLVDQGYSPADARREAERRFGDLSDVTSECRAEYLGGPTPASPSTSWSWQIVWLDLKHAVRGLRREPGFVAVVVGTLTLGIGAMTAVFSVLNSVILNPLPYPEPDRLVRIYNYDPGRPDDRTVLTVPDLADFREKVGGLQHVAAFYTYSKTGYDLTGIGHPRRVDALPVSSGYFEALGVTPLLGRTFRREEEVRLPDNRSWIVGRVVILSHHLWREYTNADPNVIGTRLTMNGEPRTVVGVMRPGFHDAVAGDMDLWVPQSLDAGRWNSRGNQYLSAIARLRPGVTLGEAQSQIDAVNAAIKEQHSDVHDDLVRLVPLYESVVGSTPGRLYILFGAAAFVLLIASVNVANLLLARSISRQRELAIRAALGCSKLRLIQGQLVESLLLSGVGGGLGLIVATLGVRTLLAISPESVARAEEVSFNPLLLAFAAGISLATALLSGLAPALHFAKARPGVSLRDGTRGQTGSRPRQRTRSVLVSAQVALALVLLVGAGLLIKSFVRIHALELGIDPKNVTTFEVHLPDLPYAAAERRIAFHLQLQERLRSHPGVRTASAISRLPATGSYHPWGFQWENANGEREHTTAQIRVVEGNYFEAFGIPLLHGRLFESSDRADTKHVALITQAAVERAFPDREPLGRRIRVSGREFEVIGVVGNVVHEVRGNVVPGVYLSHTQYGDNRNWALTQVVAGNGDHRAIADAAARAVAALDPNLVVYNVRGMDDVLAREIGEEQFVFMLMAVFASVAVSLAAIGLYGVLSYSVSQRTQEIGLRIALGARTEQIMRTVVGGGVLLAGAGIAIGLATSWGLSRLLESILFEVSARDPVIFVGVAVGLGLVALVSGYLPARRATRIHPMEALRNE